MNRVSYLVTVRKDTVQIPVRSGATDINFFVDKDDEFVAGSKLFTCEYSRVLESHFLPKELSISRDNIGRFLNVVDGEYVEKGDIIAEKYSPSGLTKQQVVTEQDGVVSYKRLAEGYINILAPSEVTEMVADFSGVVKQVNILLGLEVETDIMSVRCFASKVASGGVHEYLPFSAADMAVAGDFVLLGDGTSVYTKESIAGLDLEGKVVFVGRFLYAKFAIQLYEQGVLAVVTYAMHYDEFLQLPGTVYVLGGFGQLSLPESIVSLMQSLDGMYISLSKRRPTELMVPGGWSDELSIENDKYYMELKEGQQVVVRDLRYFGEIGTIVGFEDEYAEVEMEKGGQVLLKMASLDIIKGNN